MKKINGTIWKQMLISGANAMINDIPRIDALNVFPVPDGDTGSNMGATIEYAIKEIKQITSTDITIVADKFARGMLLGARGNSGVILSQIFKGFEMGFKNKKEVTSFDIVKAFEQAKEYAYKSVMKPMEGTILTIIRMTTEGLQSFVTPSDTIENVFMKVVKLARKAADETPEMLPILKEVGVTDSGGEGLYLIFEGMLLALQGKSVVLNQTKSQNIESFFNVDEDYDGELGYCTEFIIELKSKKHFNKAKFQGALEKFGSSIIVVHDDDILKVHMHVKKPGVLFNFAQKFGEFIKLKSENMTIQANESQTAKNKNKLKVIKEKNDSSKKINIGIISVNIGQGIIDDMKELGTNFVIEGGQQINPSALDFINAIDQINANKIIILTNNSNVILAAQQAAQTIKTKKVIIIPSKTQVQGLSALMSFNRDISLEENKIEMMDAIKEVKTGQVTIASKTTKIKGVQVKTGEYLAIAERKIISSEVSKVKSAIVLVQALIDDESEIVTIYYGVDSTNTDAEEVASFIETHYDVEVEIKNGGQPVYNFLIAFE